MKKLLHKIFFRLNSNYKDYWNNRYNLGFNSGDGSYGKLAEFKKEVINDFLKSNNIDSVIDFGCGDGNNINGINFRQYLGLDISPIAIEFCKSKYKDDRNKQFRIYNPKIKTINEKADLVISLDVLYHIVDDNDYFDTLNDIFLKSKKFIILYTSIDKIDQFDGEHIKHRNTLSDIKKFGEFSVLEIKKQKFPDLSFADFIFLKKND